MAEGKKYDAGKPRLDLVDPFFIIGIGKIRTHGVEKYEGDTWRDVPDATNRYYAAALRHLLAWRTGEKNDPDTGMHHLYHAACNLMFLCALDKNP